MQFSYFTLTYKHKSKLFGFMKNVLPQGLLVGLSEMPEVHEEEKLLVLVHKPAQEHLSQSQLVLLVLVVESE